MIGKLETPVPGILQGIERDWPLSEDSRSTLAEYLALQAVRSPAWDQSYRVMTEDWLRTKRSNYDCTDEQWQGLVEHVTGDSHRHESMVEQLAKMTTLVGSMHWTLVTFSIATLWTWRIASRPGACPIREQSRAIAACRGSCDRENDRAARRQSSRH
jgi:hypothetical protein